MKGLRIAGGLVSVLLLAGCAGQQLSFGDNGGAAAPPKPQISMAGRWLLAEAGAPSCSMHFGGGPGIHAGPIEPEGGCPGQFFTARHWELSKDGRQLTIDDYQMNVLAQMQRTGDRYAGKSNAGRPVTLARAIAPGSGLSWQNSSSTASRSPATPTAPR